MPWALFSWRRRRRWNGEDEASTAQRERSAPAASSPGMEMDAAAGGDEFIHTWLWRRGPSGTKRQAVGGGSRKATRACHVCVRACMEEEEEEPAGDAPAAGWWVIGERAAVQVGEALAWHGGVFTRGWQGRHLQCCYTACVVPTRQRPRLVGPWLASMLFLVLSLVLARWRVY